MAFRVGQKVVCVDDAPPRNPLDNAGRRLVLNAIYTIRGIDPENGTGLYLVEVPCGLVVQPYSTPIGWSPNRFRPIVERKTDTGFAILTEILNGQRVPEKV